MRLASNASGTANRVIVCYKSATLDPEFNPALENTRWHDLGRPEQTLVGVQYITDNESTFNTDYVIITNSNHWVYAGTGLSDGDKVRGITGYEVDKLHDDVARPQSQNQTILAASRFTGRDGTNTLANASIYQAPSGAWVFATGTDGFTYLDDVFRSTTNFSQANGYYAPDRGFAGGGIDIRLGGADNLAANNMSGGWRSSFDLTTSGSVMLTFRYALSRTPEYESDEYSEMMLDVDGQLHGTQPEDYIARIVGNGDGGDWLSTNWQIFTRDLGEVAAGNHQLTIGGFGNQRSDATENTEILIHDLTVTIANN